MDMALISNGNTCERQSVSVLGLVMMNVGGLTSAIVRYAEEEPAEEKKKMIDQHTVCVMEVSQSCVKATPVMICKS